MIRLLQILILSLTMNSCLTINGRADLIEQNSDLKLPEDYIVLQDTVEESGMAGSDYLITVELEFDSLNFEQLMKTLPENSNEWIEDGGNYYYNRSLDKSERVSIIIDPASRLLLYIQDKI
ncbi:MAG: hypothetical protein P8I31_00390 [Bacteroidia bacterium]|jgi:hypothetical protein|nr:hypothetical protein [Bacteroidia bacterium]